VVLRGIGGVVGVRGSITHKMLRKLLRGIERYW
jgi:hypothetical protein